MTTLSRKAQERLFNLAFFAGAVLLFVGMCFGMRASGNALDKPVQACIKQLPAPFSNLPDRAKRNLCR